MSEPIPIRFVPRTVDILADVGTGFTPARAPVGAGSPKRSRTIVRPRRHKAGAYTMPTI
jgi:hypothetical protein